MQQMPEIPERYLRVSSLATTIHSWGCPYVIPAQIGSALLYLEVLASTIYQLIPSFRGQLQSRMHNSLGLNVERTLKTPSRG